MYNCNTLNRTLHVWDSVCINRLLFVDTPSYICPTCVPCNCHLLPPSPIWTHKFSFGCIIYTSFTYTLEHKERLLSPNRQEGIGNFYPMCLAALTCCRLEHLKYDFSVTSTVRTDGSLIFSLSEDEKTYLHTEEPVGSLRYAMWIHKALLHRRWVLEPYMKSKSLRHEHEQTTVRRVPKPIRLRLKISDGGWYNRAPSA